jgi:lipocalin
VKYLIKFLISIYIIVIIGCTSNPQPDKTPENNKIVADLLRLAVISYNTTSGLSRFAEPNVDFERFLGTWNEIERIPISVQGDLRNVQAIYTPRSHNAINVRNQGRDGSGNLVTIDGFALIFSPPQGILKVAFFPFFYSDYFILAVDRENYQHALIGGGSTEVLWLFSRTTSMDSTVRENYINLARSYGYNVGRLQSFRD